MEQGWIKLYRKLLEHPVFTSRDDKLFKTFAYSLLRANHRDIEVFFNHQMIPLKSGQFITGREQAARDLGYSPRTFDRKIHDLQKLQILTRTMTRRFSIISITNWNTYQSKPEDDDPLPARKMHGTCLENDHRQEGREGKKKDPSEISAEISVLVSKQFPGKESLFQEVKEAISSTRKTGKLAQGVILAFLRNVEKFSQEQIQAGCRVYLEKAYHTQGKNEKYLLGIIRNHQSGEKVIPQQFKSTGSPLLDDYYQKHAEQGAGR